MFSDTENCLNTYTFACMYRCTCTPTQFKHTHIRWCHVYYIWEAKCFVPPSSSIPNLYFCTIVLVIMKVMTNKKKQFHMYGWNKWYKMFVKYCNIFLLQLETAVLNIDGSHQWKLTVRTNDSKWFRWWRKKTTQETISKTIFLYSTLPPFVVIFIWKW